MVSFFAWLVETLTNASFLVLKHFLKEDFLIKWKPIHLCWWFEKHGLPVPRYFIGLTTTSTSHSTSSSSSSSTSSTSTSSTSSSTSSTTTSTTLPYMWNNYLFASAGRGDTTNTGIISVTEKRNR